MSNQSNSNASEHVQNPVFSTNFAPGGNGAQTATNFSHASGNTVVNLTTDHGAVKAGKDVALAALNADTKNTQAVLSTSGQNYGHLLSTTQNVIQGLLDQANASQTRAQQRFATEAQFARQTSQAAGQQAQAASNHLIIVLGGFAALVLVLKG